MQLVGKEPEGRSDNMTVAEESEDSRAQVAKMTRQERESRIDLSNRGRQDSQCSLSSRQVQVIFCNRGTV